MVYADTAIAVVTYRRNELLGVLFDSIAEDSAWPGCVFVVDNAADPETERLCGRLAARLAEGGGDAAGMGAPSVKWIPMETNTGSSGGFSRGVQEAYDAGYDWIWVMDDDVALLPGATATLHACTERALAEGHGLIQCSRIDSAGEPYHWQYRFIPRLGIYNPVVKPVFRPGEDILHTNTACFEGCIFHRSVTAAIGLPDPRFFIYMDDAAYGYLAAKKTDSILIGDVLMRRTRDIGSISVGGGRKLRDTSDMARYHIMRNRGLLARYVRLNGEYNPVLWAVGTVLALAKEMIRLRMSGDFRRGMRELMRGMRDARSILRDPDWRPMPPLG